jgi:hypothetical protein
LLNRRERVEALVAGLKLMERRTKAYEALLRP